MVPDFLLGDMTSTVYGVRGGLEDWSYGAGWDFEGEASMLNCKPYTYKWDHETMTEETLSHIRTAMYLIETSDNKVPPEDELGGRLVKGSLVDGESIKSRN